MTQSNNHSTRSLLYSTELHENKMLAPCAGQLQPEALQARTWLTLPARLGDLRYCSDEAREMVGDWLGHLEAGRFR